MQRNKYFQTFVHELGHNLGMDHDQHDIHAGRGCEGKGFMSSRAFIDHLLGWTDCNRNDLLWFYNYVLDTEKNGWCLEGKFFYTVTFSQLDYDIITFFQ